MTQAGTILLVEDDPTDVLLLRRAFERVEVKNPLEVVEDGDEAVAYLSGLGAYADRARHPLPSLVLLDIRLPRRSGLEVLRWMRQQPELRRLAAVMLTSSAEPADIARAYDAGANGYHVKARGFQELLELVEALKTSWLTWIDLPADIPTRRVARASQDGGSEDDDPIFPPITDLTNPVLSAKSKVFALLSRHPEGLTPEQLAAALLSRGLAAGSIAVLVRRVEEILRRCENGPAHRRVVRTGDGRYRAIAFW
jgi:CheY-like chemotaxis protein